MLYLLGCSRGSSTGRAPIRAEVVEYGIFDKLGSIDHVRTPTAVELDRGVQVRLATQTEIIPAKLGISFGIRTRLEGGRLGSRITCAIRLIHPRLVDPNLGAKKDVEEWFTTREIGKCEAAGYTFSREWEIVPGEWTIQLLYENKVIAERSFTVICSSPL